MLVLLCCSWALSSEVIILKVELLTLILKSAAVCVLLLFFTLLSVDLQFIIVTFPGYNQLDFEIIVLSFIVHSISWKTFI